jgi:hypothetical protein
VLVIFCCEPWEICPRLATQLDVFWKQKSVRSFVSKNILETITASKLVADNYLTYGKYCNTTRACVDISGLKAVERRVLLGVNDVALGKFQRSNLVVGHVLGKYHPHGDCYGSLAKMVLDNMVEGHGYFGSFLPGDQPAAMRYTSVRAIKEFDESVFNLVPFVPQDENEFGIDEPRYLPVPVPLALILSGSIGIGVGMLTNIPAFSPASLVKAFETDNPDHLRAPKGVRMLANSVKSIWETGDGFIQYALYVTQQKSSVDEGRIVSVIEGNPKLFYPNVNGVFAKELEDELVYIRDESTKDVKLVVSRVKAIKRISDDDVTSMAEKASTKMSFVRIYISDGEKAIRMGLRDWLHACWKNYRKATFSYRLDLIRRFDDRIKIYELIPVVAPLLQKNMGIREIAQKTGETLEVIREVEGKPLRMLRKSDFSKEISDLQEKRKNAEQITPETLRHKFLGRVS